MADIWKEDHKIIVDVDASGSGAMSETLDYPKPFELVDVRLKVGVAPATAENFTVTIDALAGSAFDTNILTVPMAGVTSEIILDIGMKFKAGDKIVFAWANSDGRTWGLTYRYRRI